MTLALANKESLVAAGELALAAQERGGGLLLPVDSEHSALLPVPRGPTAARPSTRSSSPPPAARSAAAAARRARGRHRRGGARASDLAHGAEDHGRLGDAREQGARADRGALPLRPSVRADRGRRASDLDRARARPLPRRRGARAPRLPGHARADLVRAHAIRSARRPDVPQLDLAGRPDARVRGARPRDVPAARARAATPASSAGPTRAPSTRRTRSPSPRSWTAGCRSSASPRSSRRRSTRRTARRRATSTSSSRPDAAARRARRARSGGRMSIFVSILGLGFLILIHEAGHFFVARAVGMNPRKFYIGFPPALAKTAPQRDRVRHRRDPARRLREDPGHAPARPRATSTCTSDAPSRSSPGSAAASRSCGAGWRRDDYDGRARGRRAARARRSEAPSSRRSRSSRPSAASREIGDALGPDAYWRAKTWKRVAVIFAGPGANLVLAVVLFAALFMAGGGRATTGSSTRSSRARPRRRPGCVRATRSSPSAAGRSRRTRSRSAISESRRRAELTLVVERGRSNRHARARCGREQIDGDYRLGFVLARRGARRRSTRRGRRSA